MHHCPQVDAFYGASSMERLPTEVALTETTRQLNSLTLQDFIDLEAP